jgi:hypothetical protein
LLLFPDLEAVAGLVQRLGMGMSLIWVAAVSAKLLSLLNGPDRPKMDAVC